MVKKNINRTLVILSFIIEIVLVYLILNQILNHDFISPEKVTFYDYIKIKIANIF